ncbi:hypothetical protein AvCA_10040 [Azotobacter vinelandii CA]|uniref:Uncharacterized protein n=2 Tax=Azotobacter vinelandii TaxID=354 RepID=C1DNM0_AZOVD|nr:hypothetical protein [Azotobacter vinelandii]ACO77236.1 hypothetical protein Avin_10040 [Azotobacter vinelandii DJ]AGK17127.1 hypothetical protein AvCA_10040 [Azotobacter vinelandii CA]AGK19657.1 hypothetical protein AvCA6_10040 [Azotobacter vinelandii CA6]WKN22921.1 hypothetical protein AVAEIV_000931 [Azotobacter vinelandii]SFX63728.1 hypothetical protein SAMN04244547_02227 [Azotobacter vinelandii]
MTRLEHYIVQYSINGRSDSLAMRGYGEPTLDQARLQILLKHIPQLQIAEDAPWERPTRSSLESRTEELGVSDIRIRRT